MTFTTRPELSGSFGMISTTHWLGSAAGMRMLELGGSAVDAAAAAGFVLNVVEPHLCGPLGDMPAMVWTAGEEAPRVICGQAPAPAGATIAHYRDEGLDMIPGAGLLATVIPGAFDAWLVMLRDHGRLSLREILEPAIHYAANGHPILANAVANIADMAPTFRDEWPTSGAVWLPGGEVPKPGQFVKNPELAAIWERLLTEAEAVEGREAQIEVARTAHAEGFVAEAIDSYLRDACVMDGTGERRKGVLTGADMAGWRADWEKPLSADHHGWDVFKCGPWTQGPMLLQALRILEEDNIAAINPNGADFVHLVAETLKLVFADREAYFGDPSDSDIPLDRLLSRDYAAERRKLIADTASFEQRPGHIDGRETWRALAMERFAKGGGTGGAIGSGEPTMAHLGNVKGDTVHIDVVDQWGTMVSATPSGGWLKSNPIVPGLGVPLNSRAQMFWLEEGRPTSLAPGRRPRTTLTPSMARGPDGRRIAFGTPGGDQQDQWQLSFILRLIHHGVNLQEGIEAPLFHTSHAQGSFYPRALRPGHLMVEPHLGEATIAALRDKGHDLEVSEPWAVGRLCAASQEADGTFRAGATPRLMQAYAAGR